MSPRALRGATAFVALLAAAALGHAVLVRRGLACPMGDPSVEALETQRRAALAVLRGEGLAPSKDAFGFVLGGTTRDAFVQGSGERGERCGEELEGALVRCIGDQGEVVARFDPAGTLVGADRIRYVADVEDALAMFREVASAKATCLGAPTRAWGDRSTAYLEGPLHQVGVAYRFTDVAVDVSATHIGPGKVAIREQMRAIPTGAKRGG